MTTGSLAHKRAIRGALPRLTVGAADTINIGFLGPLSGPVESWGLPGLNGCRIWTDSINREGGLTLGGRRHLVRLVPFDCQYGRGRALEGACSLVQESDIRHLLTLGGDAPAPIVDYLTHRKLLTATLLPSDLSPDTPYLIAPSETHLVCNVTGIDWLARNRPGTSTAAILPRKRQRAVPAGAARHSVLPLDQPGRTKNQLAHRTMAAPRPSAR